MYALSACVLGRARVFRCSACYSFVDRWSKHCYCSRFVYVRLLILEPRWNVLIMSALIYAFFLAAAYGSFLRCKEFQNDTTMQKLH